jgi:hypothetical protein
VIDYYCSSGGLVSVKLQRGDACRNLTAKARNAIAERAPLLSRLEELPTPKLAALKLKLKLPLAHVHLPVLKSRHRYFYLVVVFAGRH